MAYVWNAQVVKASKQVKGIDLGFAKEYNSTKVFVDSKDSEDFRDNSWLRPIPGIEVVDLGSTQKIKINEDNSDALDKLCTLYVRSKSIRVVQKNKYMILTPYKLKEMHTNLWGPYDQLLQLDSTYAIILISKHIQNTCTLYLQENNNFIDAFQA